MARLVSLRWIGWLLLIENKSGGKARRKLSKKGNDDGAVAQSGDGDDACDDEPNDEPDVEPDDAPGTEPNSTSAA